MKTTRRTFLEVCVVLGGASAVGCSTSSPAPVDAPGPGTDAPVGPPTDSGPFACGSVSGTISINHGHALVVPLADVAAGADRTYDIMGGSVHTHSVTITGAQFAMLATGAEITVTSTAASAHMHDVAVSCAAA